MKTSREEQVEKRRNLHQRWGRGTARREGGEMAGGGRIAAVERRVVYFLKIQVSACIGRVSWLSR